MSCTFHDQLAGLLYDELAPTETARLEAHLKECPTCRQELAALRDVRQLLDQATAPELPVDVAAVYRKLAERQGRRLVRWRRAAVGLAGVAALVVLALGLPLEVRFDKQQLIIHWGTVPDAVVQHVELPSQVAPTISADEEQIQLLRTLVHALKQDADLRDAQRQQELARLQIRLAILERQAERRWTETEKNVAALYILTQKGNEP